MAKKAKIKALYDRAEVHCEAPIRDDSWDWELDYLASLRAQAGEILEDRQSSYFAPSTSLRRIASIWTGVLGCPVTSREVALCLAGLKMLRESYSHSEDNVIDGMNYIAMAGLDAV